MGQTFNFQLILGKQYLIIYSPCFSTGSYGVIGSNLNLLNLSSPSCILFFASIFPASIFFLDKHKRGQATFSQFASYLPFKTLNHYHPSFLCPLEKPFCRIMSYQNPYYLYISIFILYRLHFLFQFPKDILCLLPPLIKS